MKGTIIKRRIFSGYINMGSGEWDWDFYQFLAKSEKGELYETFSFYDQYVEGDEVELDMVWTIVPEDQKKFYSL